MERMGKWHVGKMGVSERKKYTKNSTSTGGSSVPRPLVAPVGLLELFEALCLAALVLGRLLEQPRLRNPLVPVLAPAVVVQQVQPDARAATGCLSHGNLLDGGLVEERAVVGEDRLIYAHRLAPRCLAAGPHRRRRWLLCGEGHRSDRIKLISICWKSTQIR